MSSFSYTNWPLIYIYIFFNIYSDSLPIFQSVYLGFGCFVCLVFCLVGYFFVCCFLLSSVSPLYSLDINFSSDTWFAIFFSPFHRLPFHSVAHWLFPLLCRSLLVWHNPICFLLLLLPRPTPRCLIKTKKKSLPRTKSRCLYSPEGDKQEAINIINKKNIPHIEI